MGILSFLKLPSLAIAESVQVIMGFYYHSISMCLLRSICSTRPLEGEGRGQCEQICQNFRRLGKI